jgi:two-component system, OmpR family, phosphate regulon sensor histidine kinase PhoR
VRETIVLWKRSLVLRLLVPYLATLVAVVASLYAYTDRVVADLYLDTLVQNGLAQARLLGTILPWDEHGPALDARCARLAAEINARITIIAADGSVLGDSARTSANMENHGGRPEVRAALSVGQGHDARGSVSVGEPLFYSAWRQTIGNDTRVIRLAIPINRVHDMRSQMRAAAWLGLAVAALAALWPALAISRRTSRRVERLAKFVTALDRDEKPLALQREGSDAIGRLEGTLIDAATRLSGRLRSAQVEQQNLEAALNGMAEGVLVIDDGGTVVLCNRRAEELFGVPVGKSCVGRPLIEVTRQPEIHQIVRDVVAGEEAGKTLVREVVLERPRPLVLQITANPLSGPGSARTHILVCHDISELKRLQNNQRDFVANVSHELRTPLSAIQGYSETLLSGALDHPEKARGFLAIIERHARRLGSLVDDLLTLSDIELGRTELHRRPVAAAGVIESACEILREHVRRAGLDLHKEIAVELPPLDVDADRIVQALVNLIDNAVKYTPQGGHIMVTARPADGAENPDAPVPRPPKGWVELAVADTGVGVPPKDLPNLTRRFYRVDKARSRERGGTGLGLAIVKHIIQAHGGWLRIESAVNRGTTVLVYLPASSA